MNDVFERELKQLEDEVIQFKIQEQVKDIASKLAKAEQDYTEHEAEVKQLNERINYLMERRRDIDRREKEGAAQLKEWQQERDGKLRLLRDLEAKLSRDDRRRGDLQAELRKLTEALRDAQMCGGATVKVKAALQSRIDAISDSLSSLERESRVKKRSLESCQKRIETLETKIADALAGPTKEKDEIRKELAEKGKDMEEAIALLQESKIDRDHQQSKMDREVSAIMRGDYLKMLEDERKNAAQERSSKEERLAHKKEEFRKFWRKVVDGNEKRRTKTADLLRALEACRRDRGEPFIRDRAVVKTTPKQLVNNLHLKLDNIIRDFQQLMKEWPAS